MSQVVNPMFFAMMPKVRPMGIYPRTMGRLSLAPFSNELTFDDDVCIGVFYIKEDERAMESSFDLKIGIKMRIAIILK